MSDLTEYTVRVHFDEDGTWAEVLELPGVFATGDTDDELRAGLQEAIQMYLDEDNLTIEAWGHEQVADRTIRVGA